MGFLMVGHTHEDIDQSFSCLSRLLGKVDALTVEGTKFLNPNLTDMHCYAIFVHESRYRATIYRFKSISSRSIISKVYI